MNKFLPILSCKRPALILASCLLFLSCSKTLLPSKNASGRPFPSVVGESLEKKTVRIPEDLTGQPTVLLVGYLQKTQFDIDRWILGLLQLETPVKIVEVATIAGMMPQMLQGFINGGMRKGIPDEDWKNVVTVYGDANKIIEALGNEAPQNAYVVLIDKTGLIQKIYNRGYSANYVKELDQLIRSLNEAAM